MKTMYYMIPLMLLFSGCSKEATESNATTHEGPLSVYVVNYPLQYFAEMIGGEWVDVRFPTPPDEDPAYWSPGPEVVAEYQKADIILLNGADYAKWIPKVSLSPSKLVNTSRDFSDRLVQIEQQSTHTHGPEGAHAHGGFAFTTWLDVPLAIEQARTVKTALARAVPDSQATFDTRLAELEKRQCSGLWRKS